MYVNKATVTSADAPPPAPPPAARVFRIPRSHRSKLDIASIGLKGVGTYRLTLWAFDFALQEWLAVEAITDMEVDGGSVAPFGLGTVPIDQDLFVQFTVVPATVEYSVFTSAG